MLRRTVFAVMLLTLVATVPVLAWVAKPPSLAIPAVGVVLGDVTVVNPGVSRDPGRTVTLGETIERIEAGSGSEVRVAAYAGAYLLPGLIDLHVHYPPAWAPGEQELFSLLFLAHGVTGIRDVGNLFGSIESHRRRIATGRLAGPRIFHCGRFLDGDPPTWPGARAVANSGAGRQAVDELASQGADCVKVYNALGPETFVAVREAASRHDLPLVAHVPRRMSIAQMGPVEVQHLMGLTRNWAEVGPERISWYAKTAREQGTRHTPTLVAFAQGEKLGSAEGIRDDAIARLMPAHHREILWDPSNPWVRAFIRVSGPAPRLSTMQRTVRALRNEGVPILVGSDAGNPFVVPGMSLHQELRLLAGAGFSAEEAWEAATRRAGGALGRPRLGTLRPGAPADLLIFREDPTRNLAALATLEAVIAGGRLYPKSALDEALEHQRAHFESGLPRLISRGLARAIVSAMRLQGLGD